MKKKRDENKKFVFETNSEKSADEWMQAFADVIVSKDKAPPPAAVRKKSFGRFNTIGKARQTK